MHHFYLFYGTNMRCYAWENHSLSYLKKYHGYIYVHIYTVYITVCREFRDFLSPKKCSTRLKKISLKKKLVIIFIVIIQHNDQFTIGNILTHIFPIPVVLSITWQIYDYPPCATAVSISFSVKVLIRCLLSGLKITDHNTILSSFRVLTTLSVILLTVPMLKK